MASMLAQQIDQNPSFQCEFEIKHINNQQYEDTELTPMELVEDTASGDEIDEEGRLLFSCSPFH